MADHLLVRPSRSRRNKRASAAIVGAVSAVSVLVLVLLGDAPTGLGLVAAFGLGLLAARTASPKPRTRAEAVDGEERYAPHFDQLPLGTLVVRASDLELDYVSPEAERLLGIPRRTTHTIGDLWSARLHDLDREQVLGAWHAWLAGARSEPFRAEYRFAGAEGRDVCVEDFTFFVPAADGAPATLRRHLVDVTRRRRLEEQAGRPQRPRVDTAD